VYVELGNVAGRSESVDPEPCVVFGDSRIGAGLSSYSGFSFVLDRVVRRSDPDDRLAAARARDDRPGGGGCDRTTAHLETNWLHHHGRDWNSVGWRQSRDLLRKSLLSTEARLACVSGCSCLGLPEASVPECVADAWNGETGGFPFARVVGGNCVGGPTDCVLRARSQAFRVFTDQLPEGFDVLALGRNGAD
jgi:hypothetical protein